MPTLLRVVPPRELTRISASTVAHYQGAAASFWEGTRDHDVSQNVAALLRHLAGPAPRAILDFGCGPGAISPRSAPSATTRWAWTGRRASCHGAPALRLRGMAAGSARAPASRPHASTASLPPPCSSMCRARSCRACCSSFTQRSNRAAFCSFNPHGPDIERWQGQRYGCYLSLTTWRGYLESAGFDELEHYYRPEGVPRVQQPWLASVWRRRSLAP